MFDFAYGSLPWLVFNLGFDLLIGIGGFLMLVVVIPRWTAYVPRYWNPGGNKGKGAWMVKGGDLTTVKGFVKLHIWLGLQLLKILTLIVALAGIFLFLVFSTGWRNPFQEQVVWFGVQAPGWLFDLVYARANDLPNGAHIVSYLCPAAFSILVWAKTVKKTMKLKPSSFVNILGDPFQGVAALVFLAGFHELPWIAFYYTAYFQYLSFSIFYEVLRDVSFIVMMALFLLAFSKYPGRVVPFSVFKKPMLLYVTFLAGWFVIPALFGYHLFPITTLNNTNFGIGLYQETPFFTWWWVNALEVGSWIFVTVMVAYVTLRGSVAFTGDFSACCRSGDEG